MELCVHMERLACESCVRELIPLIRASVAKELIKKHRYKQTEVAKKLGITQASISWYLSGKRGKRETIDQTPIINSKPFKKTVKGIVEAIKLEEDPTRSINQYICECCKSIHKLM